jgi:hypothetical protein
MSFRRNTSYSAAPRPVQESDGSVFVLGADAAQLGSHSAEYAAATGRIAAHTTSKGTISLHSIVVTGVIAIFILASVVYFTPHLNDKHWYQHLLHGTSVSQQQLQSPSIYAFDKNNKPTVLVPKEQAHENGLAHRVVSVIVCDAASQHMMLHEIHAASEFDLLSDYVHSHETADQAAQRMLLGFLADSSHSSETNTASDRTIPVSVRVRAMAPNRHLGDAYAAARSKEEQIQLLLRLFLDSEVDDNTNTNTWSSTEILVSKADLAAASDPGQFTPGVWSGVGQHRDSSENAAGNTVSDSGSEDNVVHFTFTLQQVLPFHRQSIALAETQQTVSRFVQVYRLMVSRSLLPDSRDYNPRPQQYRQVAQSSYVWFMPSDFHHRVKRHQISASTSIRDTWSILTRPHRICHIDYRA